MLIRGLRVLVPVDAIIFHLYISISAPSNRSGKRIVQKQCDSVGRVVNALFLMLSSINIGEEGCQLHDLSNNNVRIRSREETVNDLLVTL